MLLTGSILNADINASAAIVDTKLAQITTASKVHGTAITGLASVPSGAGILPIANIASGTATGAKFVRDDGTLAVPAYPNLSNVLFQYIGNAEQQGAGEGEYAGTSLNPNGATGNYRFLQTSTTSYVIIGRSKWTKISGVSTITVYCRIWVRDAVGQSANLKVDVGGQSGNVAGTVSQTTPEWKNFTIDVSGLSNGTVYDVTVSMLNTLGNDDVYCSNYVGFGS